MNKDKKRKIGASYSRVSDDDSAGKVHGSLEQQEHIARETAENLSRSSSVEHIIKYVLTEKEGQSGGSTKRPQYQYLWDLISLRRIDFVIAKDISRLNRSIRDFCDLMDHCKKHGVSVHIKSLDIDFNSPMGELIYKLLALIAEFERTLIIERTRSGIRSGQLNNSKIHGGRVLLGFDKDPNKAGVWIPNKRELKQVERVLDLIPKYDSYKSICDEITKEGIVNKYGTPFTSDSLHRLVRSRKYEGILEIKDGEEIIVRNLGFGLVTDLKKLETARAKLREFDEKFSSSTRMRNRMNLLTGLLQYKDGTKFRGTCGTTRAGDKKHYYWNDKHKIGINADDLEKAVIDAIACYRDDKEVQQYTSEAVRQMSLNLDTLDGQIASVRIGLKKLRDKEHKLLDTLLEKPAGEVLKWLEGQIGDLRKEQTEMEGSLQKLEREKMVLQENQPNPRDMKKVLEFVFKNFEKADPSVRRNFIRQIFDKIVVSEGNQVGLFWRFTECGFGGNGFALGGIWGGQFPEPQTGGITPINTP